MFGNYGVSALKKELEVLDIGVCVSVDNGLFEMKEFVNEKTGWGGTQTLITPKGRETFRLLMQGI